MKIESFAITLEAIRILKLRQAVRRTSQFTNQLLALSRADARSANSQPMQRVDLRQLCEMLLEIHLDAAAAEQIDLGLEAADVHTTGHEWLLREPMGNLVDNAIRYTPRVGCVTLRCALVMTPDHLSSTLPTPFFYPQRTTAE